MQQVGLDPAAARAVLGAGLAVARADGAVDEHEQRFLAAAAEALGVDLRTVEAVSAEELKETLVDPLVRLRVIQALEVLVLLDGNVIDVEIETVRWFSEVLDVTDTRLQSLRRIRQGQLRLLQLDLLRRSPMWDMGVEVWQKRGLSALWHYLAAPYARFVDPAVASRYQALSELPKGTLGRTYWAHMRLRGFPFPGERSGLPEELVRHDLTHVLSGYDTDIAGEVATAAFIAGFLRHDPFSYLFMVLVHTHLDLEVFTGHPQRARLGAEPELIVEGWVRGSRVKRDLYDLGWDFWQDLPRPIAEVREELGIDPPAWPDPW